MVMSKIRCRYLKQGDTGWDGAVLVLSTISQSFTQTLYLHLNVISLSTLIVIVYIGNKAEFSQCPNTHQNVGKFNLK